MPTFCRHNRFIERCPICRKTLPGQAASAGPSRRASARRAPGAKASRRRTGRDEGVRLHHEQRAADDGYRCTLVPGLRASADALRLAEEIAFSCGRLQALEHDPPGLYGEVRALAAQDLERATWACFLIAYLSPLDDAEPFAGIRPALAAAPTLDLGPDGATEEGAELPGLAELPLGPRTSHDPARGAETLVAYRQWVIRSSAPSPAATGADKTDGGRPSQRAAFTGDPGWSPQRRFERVFERLALPGLGRTGRYDLLVTLGYLDLYGLRPGALHLGGAGGLSGGDSTTLAAKRVFGIGDPLLLERRAAALAHAAAVPVAALDLALGNWASPRRATVGVPEALGDAVALERTTAALGL